MTVAGPIVLPRAVLFDADGVLVDSFHAYRRVWDKWSELRGLEPDLVWSHTHARRPVETITEVAPFLDAVAEYELLKAYVAEEPPFALYPGVSDLLHALPGDGWAVVTSGLAATVARRLSDGGAPVPAVLVDGDSVACGKPHPEGYLAAAVLLGVRPVDCLVVEDAPAGVIAGLAAGMRVLAIASTHDVEDLRKAHTVVGALHEAHPHVMGWLAGTTHP